MMPPQEHSNRTSVSVILAVFNEGSYIEQSVRSLAAQSAPDFDLEVLVIDGKSTDGTSEIVKALALADPRVRLLLNEDRKTPFAFNLGLREARGEYVCILGAHAIYPKDYISVCLNELRAHDAVGCSGGLITKPANAGLQARLAAWTMAHRFASSGSSVRTQAEGFVDTIPYPVMFKQALLDLGGYDEQLHRNQDNDMNQRLRAAGHKLYLTGKTQVTYFAKPNPQALVRYGWQSGLWNALTLRRNRHSMALRHFVPAWFASALLVLAIGAATGAVLGSAYGSVAEATLLLIVATHGTMGLLAGAEIAYTERDMRALLLAPVIFAFHVAYGLGTLAGLCRLLTTVPSPSCQARLQPAFGTRPITRSKED